MREKYGLFVGLFTLIFLLAFKFITLIGIAILSFFVAKELKQKDSILSYLSIIIVLLGAWHIEYALIGLSLIMFFELLTTKDLNIFYQDFFVLFLSGIMPSYIYKVKSLGNFYILGLIISIWLLDSMSYYTGKRFGKHKLSPYISPNKTIEGFLGGLLSCLIFDIFYFGFSKGVLLGVSISIVGVFGDLFKSLIKRQYGIKDFSNIFGPHGGFLDRFDSLIFSSVIFYILNAPR